MKQTKIAAFIVIAWVVCALSAAFFSGRVNKWCFYAPNGQPAFASVVFGPLSLIYHAGRWVEVRSAGTCQGRENRTSF